MYALVVYLFKAVKGYLVAHVSTNMIDFHQLCIT